MKAETKAKIKMKIRGVMNTVKEWAVPILFGTTVAAAWTGYVNSEKQGREIERLKHDQVVLKEVVNHNAEELQTGLELINENKRLLGNAMIITEGKDAA